jgi:16S rRNA (guanine1207-N2)-methyltransferase
LLPTTLHLGGPHANRRESDRLRGGDVVVLSPRGLAAPARLLIEALPKRPPVTDGVTHALFGMDTEGAPALAAAGIWPGAQLRWFHLDTYLARKVRGVFEYNERADVVAEARADPPPGPFDVVGLPVPASGEALLMRDLLESAHDALRVGGRLVATTDKGGAALRKAIDAVFGGVTQGPKVPRGAIFFADRKREKPQRRDHAHVLTPEIRPAGGGEPVRVAVETRPGTFSHGSFDRGTRALVEWYLPAEDRKVLDLGAGCGAIGIYAAKLVPEAHVVMVESNVRAAECARRNADRNEVAARCEVLVRADLEDLPGAGTFDRVLSNPPYFSDLRIARSFCDVARRALRPGGGVALVLRRGDAAEVNANVLREVFGGCMPTDAGDYTILTAKKE